MIKIVGERKAAAARLAELTGENALYTRVPRCAYEIGSFAIERDGTVTMCENSDPAVLKTLAEEGLLEGLEQPEGSEHEKAGEAAHEGAETAYTEERADTENEASMMVSDRIEEQERTSEGMTVPGAAVISLPLEGHTANSLRNLIAMLYSRGRLLSKATGGKFGVTKEQIDALQDRVTVNDIQNRLYDGLVGLIITEDKVVFAGFPYTEDAAVLRAFAALCSKMNKQALEQKRIQAKMVNDENEKYAFHIWLTRLGMNGIEHKEARSILMRNLSGHSAFRTEADKEKWQRQQAAKRAALKAAYANTEGAEDA